MADLQQWLDKIEHRNGAIKLGLEQVKRSARALSLTKPAPVVITVAGTNGKGSVCRLLDQLFTSHGFKIGCYTSPHLVHFNERITINSQPVSDEQIIESFEYLEQTLKNDAIKLTFFEFSTLAAWHLFAHSNLDILILEIGLGGRLDAVNTIPKDLAIITSIDLDHQNILGNNIEMIGYEKAGIISENLTVILGDVDMPSSVLDIANAKTDIEKIYHYQKNFYLEVDQLNYKFIIPRADVELNIKMSKHFNIRPNNVATALMALNVISQKFNKTCFNKDIINNVFDNFRFIGRCSWLDEEQTLLLDVAHNQQSIENLAKHINEIKKNTGKKITAICGMLADKDIKNSLKSIQTLIDDWHLITLDTSRGEKAEELANILNSLNTNVKYTLHDNIINSFEFVNNFMTQKFNNNHILVIFGSFYTVGPIYQYISTLKVTNK